MRRLNQPIRRSLTALALTAAALGAAVPAAAQEIVVRLGGAGTATGVAPGGQISIPIVVDLSATAEGVASVSVAVSWNPDEFDYISTDPGSFGSVSINDTDAATGALQVATHSAESNFSTFTVATITVQALAPEGTAAPLGIAVTGVGDQDGRDLSLITGERGLFLCVGEGGFWGDVNGDGEVNIIDAQQVARHAVGLSVTDAVVLGEAGDVNDDGAVNILDAQQVARFAVGLATETSRVGELLGAGCAEPVVDELRLDTDRLQMGVDSVRTVVARAYKDGVETAWPGGFVTWQSTDQSLVSVVALDDTTAEVTGVALGTAHILGTLDGLMAPAARVNVVEGRICNDLAEFVVAGVNVGESVGGQLDTGDCLDSEWYVEGWVLELTETDTVQLEMQSDELDALLYVLDDTGALVAQDDDGGVDTDALLTAVLEAGTYYIMASSALSFETGAYTLIVAEGMIEPEPCSTLGQFVVGTTSVGATETGTLDGEDCQLEDETFAEAWELELTAQTGVEFALTSADFDAFLFVVDQDGNTVAFDDNSGAGTDAYLARLLDAGTYYVFANTFAAGESGAYELSSSLTDVGPSCSSIAEFFAGNVLVGDTVSTSLTTSDCLDWNWYTQVWTLDLTATETVQIDMRSVDFDAYLLVWDDAMGVVAEDNDGGEGTDARLSLELEPGTYHIAATTNLSYQTGAYTLSVVNGQGAGSACSSVENYLVGSIAVNTTEAGSLGAEDCQLEDGTFAEAWQLDLDFDTGVRIDLESADFDAYLGLFDAEGNLVADNDDAGTGLNSRIDRNLPAGTYYVFANTFGPDETGAYQLSVTEADVGDLCATIGETVVGSVVVGDMVAANLSTADCLLDAFYTESWTLELAELDTVAFDMESPDFGSFMYVLDDTLGLVDFAFSDGPGAVASFTAALEPGSYHVVASTAFEYELGDYTLSLSAGELAADCGMWDSFLLGSIVPGEAKTEQLSGDECTLNNAYTEGWTLELAETRRVQIEQGTFDFDPMPILFDDTLGLVDLQSDGDADGIARIFQTLAPGTYYVMASSLNELQTGGYDLTLAATCVTLDELVVGTVALNQTYGGTLVPTDCLHPARDAHAQGWQLDLAGTTSFQIDLMSTDNDSYLYVWDESGTRIAFNDDGGDSFNSRLSITLEPGTYYIVATTYNPWDTGDYQLQLTTN